MVQINPQSPRSPHRHQSLMMPELPSQSPLSLFHTNKPAIISSLTPEHVHQARIGRRAFATASRRVASTYPSSVTALWLPFVPTAQVCRLVQYTTARIKCVCLLPRAYQPT